MLTILNLRWWMLSVFLFSVKANASINLSEAYQAALKRSEDLANQGELVNQAEARYSQALGAVLPNVAFSGTYLKQDQTVSSVFPEDQKTYKITATQPLFRGFREYAALKQQSILVDAQNFNREQALLQLYQDTSQSFYQVLLAEKDLRNLQTEMEVNQKRLTDIKEFRKIGRSRLSEVLSVQSNIASLDAQIESAKTLVSTTRAVFAFMTGLNQNETLVDQENYPAQIEELPFYLGKIDLRPDVKAAEKSVLAGEKGVSIAKGGHLPSLDLNGNYYFQRPGALDAVKWDVSLGLTFPIFQGGVISSGVTIATSQLKQNELALSKTRRLAEQQIETTHSQVKGDLALIAKQKALVDISNQSYEAELKDYRYGLVTNVEVLLSLTTSQESKRALDKAQYQYKIDYVKLLAQVADLRMPPEKK